MCDTQKKTLRIHFFFSFLSLSRTTRNTKELCGNRRKKRVKEEVSASA
jgi:hypothetical protein